MESVEAIRLEEHIYVALVFILRCDGFITIGTLLCAQIAVYFHFLFFVSLLMNFRLLYLVLCLWLAVRLLFLSKDIWPLSLQTS